MQLSLVTWPIRNLTFDWLILSWRIVARNIACRSELCVVMYSEQHLFIRVLFALCHVQCY